MITPEVLLFIFDEHKVLRYNGGLFTCSLAHLLTCLHAHLLTYSLAHLLNSCNDDDDDDDTKMMMILVDESPKIEALMSYNHMPAPAPVPTRANIVSPEASF